MKLSDFLSSRGIPVAEFATRIGVAEVKTVYRYLDGERIPASQVMARIWVETDGSVGPADFYDLPTGDAA